MDLEENIRIAAREFSRKITNGSYYQDLEIGFKSGALSNEARDYWYNEFKQTTSVGHLNHGKSIIVGETGVDDRIVASAHNIQSIVPIADIIPEEIISKQEFLKMHDKAVERSITEETYRESRAWDIKKEKKVSHKRNNKRK